jgi:hypothetical protein
MSSKKPNWIENKVDEYLWGKAVAYKVPKDVLTSKEATRGFVQVMDSQG